MTCPQCGDVDRFTFAAREMFGEVIAVEVCIECGMPVFSEDEITRSIECLDFDPWEFRMAEARAKVPEKSLSRHLFEFSLIVGALALLLWRA